MTIDADAAMTSVQEILAADDGPPPPPPLRETSTRSFGLGEVDIDRYISPEFARLEHERLWSRTWQWACNEEDIPEVGDHTVYEIGHRSVVIVRCAPEEIVGFTNACLHRARRLKDGPGHSPSITCPFHAWSWNLDGSLREVPCRWDFPQVSDEEFALPRVRLERWGGLVFVNFDRDARPLAEALDVIPEHFRHFPLTDKFTAVNVRKVMPANWKTVLEAFIESYHVIRTHPEVLAFTGDANTQYDVWQTTSRLFTPFGVGSPHLGPQDPEAVYEQGAGYFTQGQAASTELPDGASPRGALADINRAMIRQLLGVDLSHVSHSEMIDAIEYFVFPNWMPWGGVANGIQYRFRPHGYDPDTSIFDVRLMFPLPPGDSRPPAAPLIELAPDEPFASVPGLMGLGPVFDQDFSNMAAQQAGMKATERTGLVLGDYQESRIRHFHQLLDHRLGIDEQSGAR